MFHKTSAYVTLLNNKPPPKRVVHIRRFTYTLFLLMLYFHGSTKTLLIKKILDGFCLHDAAEISTSALCSFNLK